jgi:hypothetical protein
MPAGNGGFAASQLWSVYFGMRAVLDPPPFLLRAERELLAHLKPEGDQRDAGALLHLVQGGRD